jgi:hypothetical protein
LFYGALGVFCVLWLATAVYFAWSAGWAGRRLAWFGIIVGAVLVLRWALSEVIDRWN